MVVQTFPLKWSKNSLFENIKETMDSMAYETSATCRYLMLKEMKDKLVVYRTKFELFDAMEGDMEDCGIVSKWLISCAKLLLGTDWSKTGVSTQESLDLVTKYIDFSRKFIFVSMPVAKAYKAFKPAVIDAWAEEGWL